MTHFKDLILSRIFTASLISRSLHNLDRGDYTSLDTIPVPAGHVVFDMDSVVAPDSVAKCIYSRQSSPAIPTQDCRTQHHTRIPGLTYICRRGDL